LAAGAVVVLHYNGMGGAFALTTGASHQILMFLESLCVGAVDLFIMISGYFLCTTQKRTWGKPATLILQLSLIVSISYIARSYIDKGEGMNWFTTIHTMLPPKNYFVVLYIALYIVSPYINIVLNKLSEKGRTSFIIVMLAVFSFYPTLMDSYQILLHYDNIMGINPVGAWGQQHGYTIVGFALYYCLGAYLRLNNPLKSVSTRVLCLFMLLSVIGIYVWFNIEARFLLKDASLVDFNALSYSNPFVLLLSALLLLAFSRMHFQSGLINTLSKAAFVCYLFHLQVIPYLQIERFAQMGGWLFLHLIVSVLVIYLVSWLVWRLLDLVIKPLGIYLDHYNIVSFGEDTFSK
jgi:surface polysaccharide O-acyltransferase-like enzyme